MERFKIIIGIVTVLMVSIGYGQEKNIPLTGTNNIAQAIKSSLSTIPHLRTGNVNCIIEQYAISYYTPDNMRFFTKGRVNIDYFDIVMSDGKAIRFTNNGNGFTC